MRWFGLAMLAACGGGSADTPLTCDVIASADNCWAEAARSLYDSLAIHDLTLQGRTSCVSGDVNMVSFSAPLPQTTAELTHLAFRTTFGSGHAFEDTGENKLILDDVTLSLAFGIYRIDCGDGTAYSASLDDVLACPQPPTDGFQVDATSFSFTLVAPNVPSPLFTCSE